MSTNNGKIFYIVVFNPIHGRIDMLIFHYEDYVKVQNCFIVDYEVNDMLTLIMKYLC